MAYRVSESAPIAPHRAHRASAPRRRLRSTAVPARGFAHPCAQKHGLRHPAAIPAGWRCPRKPYADGCLPVLPPPRPQLSEIAAAHPYRRVASPRLQTALPRWLAPKRVRRKAAQGQKASVPGLPAQPCQGWPQAPPARRRARRGGLAPPAPVRAAPRVTAQALLPHGPDAPAIVPAPWGHCRQGDPPTRQAGDALARNHVPAAALLPPLPAPAAQAQRDGRNTQAPQQSRSGSGDGAPAAESAAAQ